EGDGLRGLVLDLRGNTGGILGEAVKIVGLFVPRNTVVVTTRGRLAAMNTVYRTVGEPVAPQVPMAVLIDSGSASASEIVAGALQDLDRAVIVGQRSFGKGLVQSTRPVGERGYVKLTTAKYYTPSGRCIQALDYTHRNEDGSVGTVPDSLIASFATAGGRVVYGGGGIRPDVETDAEYLSKFTASLLASGFVDDFANRYAVTHEAERGFSVDDSTYAAFCNWMAGRRIAFESGTERLLGQLRRTAEREKYAERIEGELAAIAEKIRDDQAAELQTFAAEIRPLLTDAITTRWYYDAGRIEQMLRRDRKVLRAAEVLSDRGEYTRLLTIQGDF
nr:peptidase [Rikenella sp.]